MPPNGKIRWVEDAQANLSSQGHFPYSARMMTRDQELWGMASVLLRQHGDRAPVVVAERIGQLASEEKAEGVAMWKEVARRLEQLMGPPKTRN